MENFFQFDKKIDNLPSKPDNMDYGFGGNRGMFLGWNTNEENTEPENMLMKMKILRGKPVECRVGPDDKDRFCIKSDSKYVIRLKTVSDVLFEFKDN